MTWLADAMIRGKLLALKQQEAIQRKAARDLPATETGDAETDQREKGADGIKDTTSRPRGRGQS